MSRVRLSISALEVNLVALENGCREGSTFCCRGAFCRLQSGKCNPNAKREGN